MPLKNDDRRCSEWGVAKPKLNLWLFNQLRSKLICIFPQRLIEPFWLHARIHLIFYVWWAKRIHAEFPKILISRLWKGLSTRDQISEVFHKFVVFWRALIKFLHFKNSKWLWRTFYHALYWKLKIALNYPNGAPLTRKLSRSGPTGPLIEKCSTALFKSCRFILSSHLSSNDLKSLGMTYKICRNQKIY